MPYASAERALKDARAEIAELTAAVEKLKRQQGAAMVATDRQVQAALASAENCDSHGAEIHYLRHLAWSFKTRADQTHLGAIGMIHLLSQISDGIAHSLPFDRQKAPATIRRILNAYVKRRDAAPFPKCDTCQHDQAPAWGEPEPAMGTASARPALFEQPPPEPASPADGRPELRAPAGR